MLQRCDPRRLAMKLEVINRHINVNYEIAAVQCVPGSRSWSMIMEVWRQNAFAVRARIKAPRRALASACIRRSSVLSCCGVHIYYNGMPCRTLLEGFLLLAFTGLI